jgi:acetate kinase
VWEDEVETSDAAFADLLERAPGPEPSVVAHRVVHPGLDRSIGFDERIDDRVLGAIRAGRAFAPGHNGAALEGIAATRKRYPQATQIAIFDRTLGDDAPDVATTIPGPFAWRERGYRRMGFHGISHRDAIERVRERLPERNAAGVQTRVVTIHLGSGCSMSAFLGSRPIENTMGLTPLEGLMMGARSGSVDPGLLLHLLESNELSVRRLDETLNRESGLAGLSGISLDTRDVFRGLDAGDERARLAMDLYDYRIRQGIGAMAATLGGLDAVSWSGPVGEHMPRIRAAASDGLAFLGIALDRAKNDALPRDGAVPLTEVSHADARVRTFVVPTLEAWAMCRRALRLLGAP